MPFPRAIALLNKRFTNRFIEPIVSRTSSYAVVHHVGRRSGSSYRTPINLFRCGDSFVVSLTYGPSADWVRNVQAGPSRCEHKDRMYTITSHEVVGRAEAWPCLPTLVRIALRLIRVHHFLQVSLSPDNTSQ